MKIITAPILEAVPSPSLFLAGGISGCGDWQGAMIGLPAETRLTLLNPRRDDFDTTGPSATREQIEWEYRYLREATAVQFWFPHETLCPITLFELGGALKRTAPVFVGCHAGYARREDVRVRLGLARPAAQVTDSLSALAAQIREWRGGLSV